MMELAVCNIYYLYFILRELAPYTLFERDNTRPRSSGEAIANISDGERYFVFMCFRYGFPSSSMSFD